LRGKLYFLYILCFSAGIAIGRFSSFSFNIILISTAAAFAAILFFSKKELAPIVSIPLLFLALGFLLVTLSLASIKGSISSRVGDSHEIQRIYGRCVSSIGESGGKCGFFAEVRDIEGEGKHWKTKEKVYVNLEGKPGDDIYPGVNLQLDGSIEKPQMSRWLEDHGACAYFSAKSIKNFGRADPVSRISNILRKKISCAYEDIFDEKIAGFMEGVTLSKLDKTNATILSNLRQTGLSHIVAVSGLHVGAAASLFLIIVSILGISKSAKYIGASMMAFLVLAASNFRPSAMRATLMGGLAFLGAILGRDYDPLTGVSVAALLILAWNPLALFEKGFQYSFAAAAGIILIFMREKESRGRIKGILAACAGAQLGIIPLILIRGESVPIIAVVSNLIAVPLVGPILLLGWISAFLYYLPGPLSKFFSIIPATLSKVIISSSSFLSKVPCATFHEILGILAIISYLICLYCVIRYSKGSKLFPVILSLGIAVTLVLTSIMPVPFARKADRLVIMDVGEGDAALFIDRSGSVVLVDGGPRDGKIISKLRNYGVSKIDLIVASHPHTDHIAGLVSVVDEFPVGRLIDSGFPNKSCPAYNELLDKVHKASIPRTIAREGDFIRISDTTEIEILYAPSELDYVPENPNNLSIVMMLKSGDFRILFTGDIEQEGQDELLKFHPDLNCDVLKVPHQGAADAVTESLIEASDPEICAISVGRNNKYGHPSRKALRIMEEEGSMIFRTDRDGDIEISPSNGRISVKKNGG